MIFERALREASLTTTFLRKIASGTLGIDISSLLQGAIMLTRSLIFPMHLLTLMTLPFYRNKNASSSVSLNKRFLPQMVLSSSEFTLPQAMLLLSILILLSDTANLLLPNFLPLRLRKISLRFVLIPHGRKLISCFSIHGLLASSTLTWSSFNQPLSLKNGFGYSSYLAQAYLIHVHLPV
jgi:hypothetical protein